MPKHDASARRRLLIWLSAHTEPDWDAAYLHKPTPLPADIVQFDLLDRPMPTQAQREYDARVASEMRIAEKTRFRETYDLGPEGRMREWREREGT